MGGPEPVVRLRPLTDDDLPHDAGPEVTGVGDLLGRRPLTLGEIRARWADLPDETPVLVDVDLDRDGGLFGESTTRTRQRRQVAVLFAPLTQRTGRTAVTMIRPSLTYPDTDEGTRAFTLAWGRDDEDPSGQHTVQVRTVPELDAALDRLAEACAAVGRSRLVDVYQHSGAGEPPAPYGFQLVWGHPQRAALIWLGDRPGVAVDPSLPPWPEPIRHDRDEANPRLTRLTPQRAREAVREWVQTGRRPTNVAWVEA